MAYVYFIGGLWLGIMLGFAICALFTVGRDR